MKYKDKHEKELKWMLLIARILSAIVIVVGLIIFSGYAGNFFETGIVDPYMAENYPFIENFPPLLSLVSITGLALAWKWMLVGSIIDILFCLINYFIYFIHWPLSENIRYLIAPYGINLLILIPGILFFIYWKRTRKKQKVL